MAYRALQPAVQNIILVTLLLLQFVLLFWITLYFIWCFHLNF